MTAAGHVEQNRSEAVDPYVAELLLGAGLGALLLTANTATRRVRRAGPAAAARALSCPPAELPEPGGEASRMG